MKKRNEKEIIEKTTNEFNPADSTTNSCYSLCTNVIIILMFGIFICIVKKIYETGDQEE